VVSVTTGLALSLAVVDTPSQAAPSATAYDFDADGHTDLAFGIPGEDWGDPLLEDAGAVQVIYGARYNLEVRRTRSYWTANKPGIKGEADPRDAAGSSTASGDFDRDGYADLAFNSAGGISVLYGGPDGLTARDQLLTPSHTGADDGWGSSLVAGDFDGDGRDDLAMGGHGLARQPEAGSVTVLRGTPRGLTYSGAVRLTKDSPGIEGTATKNDAFGRHLVTGRRRLGQLRAAGLPRRAHRRGKLVLRLGHPRAGHRRHDVRGPRLPGGPG
jgi:hypothetical protein